MKYISQYLDMDGGARRTIAMFVASLFVVTTAQGLSLTDRSPFLPGDFQPPSVSQIRETSPVVRQTLEFRGMYELGGSLYFLISPINQTGQWLGMNEDSEGLAVTDFDPEENRVQVSNNGSMEWLEMAATADPVGVAAAPSPRPSVRPSTTRSSSGVTRREIRPRTVSRPTTSIRQSRVTRTDSRSRSIPTRRSSPSSRSEAPPGLEAIAREVPPPAPTALPSTEPPSFNPGSPNPEGE